MTDDPRRERAGYPGWPPEDVLPSQLAYRGSLLTTSRAFQTPGLAADALWGAAPGDIDSGTELYVVVEPDGWRAFVNGYRVRWGPQDPTRLLRLHEAIIAELSLQLGPGKVDA